MLESPLLPQQRLPVHFVHPAHIAHRPTVRLHEWLDRADDDHAALLAAVTAHAETLTHDDAVARIVGERPVGWEQSKSAAVFWEHHRDLYVYAALTRQGSVRALETRLRMGASTLYHRLGGWGVAFLSFSPPPALRVWCGDRLLEGRLTWDGQHYLLLLPSGSAVALRYTRGRGWHSEHDAPFLLSVDHAALAHVIASGERYDPVALVADLEVFDRAVLGARNVWRMVDGRVMLGEPLLEAVFGSRAVDQAKRLKNKCACMWWDDSAGRCGLHAQAKGRCEDYAALPLGAR